MSDAKNSDGRQIVVIGAGGHATSVASVAVAAGYSLLCFVDPKLAPGSLLGAPILREPPAAPGPGTSFAIAAGDNARREAILRQLLADGLRPDFPALVHPSAAVSLAVEIGQGTVVMPQVAIGPSVSIGRFCILNTASAIDHDSRMLDFSSLAPGAVTGGAVRIGSRSAVSLGAVVRQGIEIGEDAVLGANSYLDRNLPARTLAHGTPAKVVRERRPGDPYLD